MTALAAPKHTPVGPISRSGGWQFGSRFAEWPGWTPQREPVLSESGMSQIRSASRSPKVIPGHSKAKTVTSYLSEAR
jgi:hypothetical protein